jgi:membrane-associated PAP2 superfamily phosphatase
MSSPAAARLEPAGTGLTLGGPGFDLRVAALGLGLLLLWDASGLDLALMQHLGRPDGFAWRHAPWLEQGFHQGGRWLSAALLAATVAAAVRAGPLAARERWAWVATTVLGLALAGLLKQASTTSCPYELAIFGGHAAHVSHWHWRVLDGGPGHCFPSGHASAGFAFVAAYFAWRPHRPALARALLGAALALGLALGAAQVLRGAHYPSHVLYTGWLAWLTGALGFALVRR